MLCAFLPASRFAAGGAAKTRFDWGFEGAFGLRPKERAIRLFIQLTEPPSIEGCGALIVSMTKPTIGKHSDCGEILNRTALNQC